MHNFISISSIKMKKERKSENRHHVSIDVYNITSSISFHIGVHDVNGFWLWLKTVCPDYLRDFHCIIKHTMTHNNSKHHEPWEWVCYYTSTRTAWWYGTHALFQTSTQTHTTCCLKIELIREAILLFKNHWMQLLDMQTMTLTLIKSWQHHVVPKALSHCKFDTFIDLWMEWKNSTDLFKSTPTQGHEWYYV